MKQRQQETHNKERTKQWHKETQHAKTLIQCGATTTSFQQLSNLAQKVLVRHTEIFTEHKKDNKTKQIVNEWEIQERRMNITEP